jgi:hypothetical protein
MTIQMQARGSVLDLPSMRPNARGLAQHGGPPDWHEESDPAGVILYVMDGPQISVAVVHAN